MPTDLPEFQYVELYYGTSNMVGTEGIVSRNFTYNHHTFLLDVTYEDEDAFEDMFG